VSNILINQYYSNIDRVMQFGKSANEQSIRTPFLNLLNEYARKFNYEVVPEVAVMGTRGKKVHPDGTVKNLWGLDIGFWESKDEKDDINLEIDAKIKKGYPLTNILFEDSNVAYLYQRGEEVAHVKVREADSLHYLITEFLSFKSETVYKFEDAIEKFKADIPIIAKTLRNKILESRESNIQFLTAQEVFLELCKAEINPDITIEDVREMLIQHLLTSDIFNKIFDDPEFHRHNTIAAELEKLIEILFTYSERKNLLYSIEHYYEAINATAASITDHHEKQKFLKVLYENFYKVYNPKAADRLGVVYTPNEIVNFMVQSTDYLLHRHFNKTLSDKNVEILDPATGTGTFLSSIIDHIPNQYLTYKYKNEIHANEVAILPYYIANLNIEFAYKQKMGYYEEFNNLCFVDTLDNTDALSFRGKQHDLFGLSHENSERIHKQNFKKISVIIGNPPYNANQKNENENNKNREYPEIDKRIKNTYVKYSTAQKTKVYDMYARFFRWASDRLDKNGILAFITNRSFIDSRTFDGFRKCVQEDFSACYIIDTKSDVRANPKIAGTTHNVFGIQTGVAIMFLVKKGTAESKCQIEYTALDDFWRKEEKLEWLRNHKIESIPFEKITPDKNNNWINLVNNDFDSLLPLANKGTKLGKGGNAIFELFSLGVVTNRDEWVYDFSKKELERKVKFFTEFYETEKERWTKSSKEIPINDFVNRTIKWTEELESHLKRGDELKFDKERIRVAIYRPFTKRSFYFDKIITHRIYQNDLIFGINIPLENIVIYFSGPSSSKPFSVLSTNSIAGIDFLEKTQSLPLYRYTSNYELTHNITDWGLKQFFTHYKDELITKEAIFYYVYAPLHNPAYRKKYELN
jgi:predicted helicase